MEVFAIVISTWNVEFQYEEYSKPVYICATEEIAKDLAHKIDTEDEVLIIPYTLK